MIGEEEERGKRGGEGRREGEERERERERERENEHKMTCYLLITSNYPPASFVISRLLRAPSST